MMTDKNYKWRNGYPDGMPWTHTLIRVILALAIAAVIVVLLVGCADSGRTKCGGYFESYCDLEQNTYSDCLYVCDGRNYTDQYNCETRCSDNFRGKNK